MRFRTQSAYVVICVLPLVIVNASIASVMMGKHYYWALAFAYLLVAVFVYFKSIVVVDDSRVTLGGRTILQWNEVQELIKTGSHFMVFRMKNGKTKRLPVLDWPRSTRARFLDFLCEKGLSPSRPADQSY